MIVTSNRSSTPAKIQTIANFGHGHHHCHDEHHDHNHHHEVKPGLYEKLTIPMNLLFAAAIGFSGHQIFKQYNLQKELTQTAPAKVESFNKKAALVNQHLGELRETDYLQDVIDSLQGKKATPGKTFGVDSFISIEQTRIQRQIDSSTKATKKHNDSLLGEITKLN